MEKNKKYEIKTVEDISNLVTKDNFENFLEDFRDIITKLVEIKELCKREIGEYPQRLMKDFIWCDDDVRGVDEITIKIINDGNKD